MIEALRYDIADGDLILFLGEHEVFRLRQGLMGLGENEFCRKLDDLLRNQQKYGVPNTEIFKNQNEELLSFSGFVSKTYPMVPIKRPGRMDYFYKKYQDYLVQHGKGNFHKEGEQDANSI